MILVDEAGLLGSPTLSKLLRVADEQQARLILVGDTRQHAGVERGSALKLLEERAGLPVAEVRSIKRQRGAYKQAVEALAQGNVKLGFDKLDRLGWVQEADASELATAYAEAVKDGKQTLVIAPTHAEGELVTDAIRSKLIETGQLGENGHTMTVLRNRSLTEAERGDALSYAPGDVIQFVKHAKGHKAGSRIVVSDASDVPLSLADRFQVYRAVPIDLAVGDRIRITANGVSKDGHALHNGSIFNVKAFTDKGDLKLDNGWVIDRGFGHWTHGYVTTSHASQGKTVDQAFIYQTTASGRATSPEQLYVSASRAREKVTLFTDDKAMLRDMLTKPRHEMTATQLLTPAQQMGRSRQRATLWQRLQRYAAKTAEQARSYARDRVSQLHQHKEAEYER